MLPGGVELEPETEGDGLLRYVNQRSDVSWKIREKCRKESSKDTTNVRISSMFYFCFFSPTRNSYHRRIRFELELCTIMKTCCLVRNMK